MMLVCRLGFSFSVSSVCFGAYNLYDDLRTALRTGDIIWLWEVEEYFEWMVGGNEAQATLRLRFLHEQR